ncbi:hypothetical protein B9G98_00316 [Wickerhamiella sorbophila]|uniref:Uncharacterized protein n=1 Tax=Wickerhamiella sorbophila TaxID=45607 RepID=A0A2T0FCH8_9ASCO|nr:hypothetical protein B9G98_00316 [Wickerhamiella sorbophila]PRT52696.1 hypothetical protein B9G98_00316 [Wickerhamiella sorbophila]
MAQTFGRFKLYSDPGIIIDTNKGKIANPRTLQNEAFEQCGALAGDFKRITAQLKHPMEIQIDDYKYYFPGLELYKAEFKCCRCNEDYFKTTKSGGKHLKSCTGSGRARIVRGDFEVQLQWATTVAFASQRRKYFVVNKAKKVYEGPQFMSAHAMELAAQDNNAVQAFLPNERDIPDEDEFYSESELFTDWPYKSETPFLMTTPRYAEQFGFRTFITDKSFIFKHIRQNHQESIGGVSAEYALIVHIVTRALGRDENLLQRFRETDLEVLYEHTCTQAWDGQYFDKEANQKCISTIAQLLYTLCSLTHYEWIEWRRESIESLDLIKSWIKKRILKFSDWSLDEDLVYSVLNLDNNGPPDVILDSVRNLFVGLVRQGTPSLSHPILAAFSPFVYDFQYNAFKTNSMLLESLEHVLYGLRYFLATSAARIPASSIEKTFRQYDEGTTAVFGYLMSLLGEVQNENAQQTAELFYIQSF